VATVETDDPKARQVLKQGMALIGKVAEVADKGSKSIKFGKEVYECCRRPKTEPLIEAVPIQN
jgi:ribosomal protein L2